MELRTSPSPSPSHTQLSGVGPDASGMRGSAFSLASAGLLATPLTYCSNTSQAGLSPPLFLEFPF